jgi:hypothetical protein
MDRVYAVQRAQARSRVCQMCSRGWRPRRQLIMQDRLVFALERARSVLSLFERVLRSWRTVVGIAGCNELRLTGREISMNNMSRQLACVKG